MSNPEDVMFSPAVKAEQMRLGSRTLFEDRDWKTEITDDLRQFLGVIDTFFFATASADGQPYIQHRGGPPGFLKTIGSHTLAFADFAGNRQYITLGHLKENDRAHIFILHFATRQRVKLWGRARVVEGDLELMERLVDPRYKAKPERAIVFTLEAWDVNCQQHIIPRYSEAEIAPAVDRLGERIKELEEEVARLKGAPEASTLSSSSGARDLPAASKVPRYARGDRHISARHAPCFLGFPKGEPDMTKPKAIALNRRTILAAAGRRHRRARRAAHPARRRARSSWSAVPPATRTSSRRSSRRWSRRSTAARSSMRARARWSISRRCRRTRTSNISRSSRWTIPS